MNKKVLGTLFLLTAIAYGQDNRVIVPIESGEATANLAVEVTGQVFSPAQKSLVVEIQSAASADGAGFAFKMPALFASGTEVKTAEGVFTAKVLTNGVAEAFKEEPTVALVKGGTVTAANGTAVAGTPSGTANDVEIMYNLTGGLNTAKTIYNGKLAVSAKAGTLVGTYADTSVALRVEVSGQTGA
ncbi:hypothetical protein [uncultured Cetobacterium sp.]|uniref:hypothetical protein n=1 Tax=uncultured Cetobacterium sp. TaxID=527638 RepID=UPI0026092547|nr:hypothetical protein [uncultured Cetobacterium sp.]